MHQTLWRGMWNGAAVWKGGNDSNSNIDNWEFITTGVVGSLVNAVKHYSGLGTLTIEWPQRHILAPDDIFTGKVLITNINFFQSYKDKKSITDSNSTGGFNNKVKNFVGGAFNFINGNGWNLSSNDEAENLEKLRNAIAKWYITIRNITIVGLLSVLVYIAIRMVISSASQEKAKYKAMITDWLVSLVLVFSLHYIMAVTVGVCDKLTNLMNDNINSGIYLEKGDKFEYNGKTYGSDESEGEPLENLVSKIRIYTQSSDSTKALSYALMYLMLTAWSLVYFIMYMKRFVFMAFYTLMAPIVALTYPIDKIGDGRSQAFNSWLKEYIYNALKQPFHLLLYTVFIGMAQEIADTNFIYTFVILWAMMQLDGTLAKWIGVDQASSTGSSLKEGVQSLVAMQGFTSLISGAKSSDSSSSGSSSKTKTSGNRIKMKDRLADRNAQNGAIPSGDADSGDGDNSNQNGGGNIRTVDQGQNSQTAQGPTSNGVDFSGYTSTSDNKPYLEQVGDRINNRINNIGAVQTAKAAKKKIDDGIDKVKGKGRKLAREFDYLMNTKPGRFVRKLGNVAGKTAKASALLTATTMGVGLGGITTGTAAQSFVKENVVGNAEKIKKGITDKASNYANDKLRDDTTKVKVNLKNVDKETRKLIKKTFPDMSDDAIARVLEDNNLDPTDPDQIAQGGRIAKLAHQIPAQNVEDCLAIASKGYQLSLKYDRTKKDAAFQEIDQTQGNVFNKETKAAFMAMVTGVGAPEYNENGIN